MLNFKAMFKIKNIFIFCFALLLVLFGVATWQAKQKQDYARKVVLSKQVRSVMIYLMLDLRDAKQATLKDVPVDNHWHERMAFVCAVGPVEYGLRAGRVSRMVAGRTTPIAEHIVFLRLRRLPKDPAVMEVQVQARDGVTLTSNFKIRLRG